MYMQELVPSQQIWKHAHSCLLQGSTPRAPCCRYLQLLDYYMGMCIRKYVHKHQKYKPIRSHSVFFHLDVVSRT